MTLKPEVCWQLPLRREDQVDDDDGHVTSVIRQWDRRHWGKGGREFHWWCTESPEAFVGTKPVYQEMEAELTEMVGPKIYDRFVALVARTGPPAQRGVRAPPPGRAPAYAGGTGRLTVGLAMEAPSRSPDRRRCVGSALEESIATRRSSRSAGRRPPCDVRRHGAEDAVVLVLFRHAPRSVHVVGLGPALGAPVRSTLSKTASSCALLRSADGVPFSRELLVTPGPHLGVPPPRPDRTGRLDRSSV